MARKLTDDTEVLTANDLKRRWSCSWWTIRRMIDDGELKCFMVGSRYRFRLEDVKLAERPPKTKRK